MKVRCILNFQNTTNLKMCCVWFFRFSFDRWTFYHLFWNKNDTFRTNRRCDYHNLRCCIDCIDTKNNRMCKNASLRNAVILSLFTAKIKMNEQKILDLLRQFEDEERAYWNWRWLYDRWIDRWSMIIWRKTYWKREELAPLEAESIIISRRYWFIKRLIERNKIDKDKLRWKNPYFRLEWWWVFESAQQKRYFTALFLLNMTWDPFRLLLSILR